MALLLPFSVSAETLPVILNQALKSNPTLEGAAAGYEAAQKELDMEESGFYPEVTMSGAIGRVYQDNSTSRGLIIDRGAAYSGYGEANLALRQMLFDGNETLRRVEAADARAMSFASNLADMKEKLAFKVASSYLQVLRSREALHILIEQRRKMSSYQDRIAAMLEEGAADETEWQQSKDVVMLMNGLVADYQGALKSAESAYLEAVGTMPDREMYKPDLFSHHIPADIESAIAMAEKNHPGLMRASHEEDATEKDIEAEKAAMLPDFSSEVSFNRVDKKDTIGGESTDARALLRMNWNFSVGGEQVSAVERKVAQNKQARAKVEELKRTIERDIRQAYAEYDTLKTKRKLANDRVVLNENLLESYEIQFEGARVKLLHLMRAESQLYKARLEKLDNDYKTRTAEYKLLARLGKLTDTLLESEKDDLWEEDKEEEAAQEAEANTKTNSLANNEADYIAKADETADISQNSEEDLEKTSQSDIVDTIQEVEPAAGNAEAKEMLMESNANAVSLGEDRPQPASAELESEEEKVNIDFWPED